MHMSLSILAEIYRSIPRNYLFILRIPASLFSYHATRLGRRLATLFLSSFVRFSAIFIRLNLLSLLPNLRTVSASPP